MAINGNLKAGLLILCIGVAAAPTLAAALSAGDAVGTTEADIRAALKARGYEVTEIAIEVEATLDGEAYEIDVSLDTGEILEIERDDDEGGDD
ncbi:MAG: hypothetical protein EX266_01300 [Rhodobacteraceae bacterium]|nr:MAG: hypothetical protein EX266_01300 [Paracoccaceae bacterium]